MAAPFAYTVLLVFGAAALTASNGCIAPDGRWQWEDSTGQRASGGTPSDSASTLIDIELSDSSNFAGSGHIALAGAVNETLTFELRIKPATSLDRLNVTASPLVAEHQTATLPPPRLYRCFPIKLSRWPGWHIRHVDPPQRRTHVFDVVVPASASVAGFPTRVDAGETVGLFGELTILEGTPEGTYTGQLSVHGSKGLATEIPLRVTVWPINLRDAGSILLVGGVDHDALFRNHLAAGGESLRTGGPLSGMANPQWRPQLQQVLAQTLDLLRSHGVTPLLTRFQPTITVEHDQTLAFDWVLFDEAFGVHGLNPRPGGPPVPGLFRLSLDEGLPFARQAAGITGRRSPPFVDQYLREWVDHFAARNWLPYLHVDTAPQRAGWGAYAFGAADYHRHATMVKAASDRLDTRCDDPFDGMPADVWRAATNTSFDQWIDIWSPPARYCDPGACEAAQIWVRCEDPPYSGTTSVYAREPDVRVLPWQAARYALGALELGTVNRWPKVESSPGPQECIEFDHHGLVFPGGPYGLDRPVASMRLKWLRRGMQDVAYLTLIRKRGLEHVAESILDTLTPYAFIDAHRHYFGDPRSRGWARNAKLWELARLIMADELLSADGLAPVTEIESMGEPMLRWRQFMSTARSVSVISEGVRVRPTRDVATVRVECAVRIENRRRIPLEGYLSFAKLPVRWSAQEPEVVIGPIAPMDTRRVTLVATAESLAWGPDGLVHLPLLFRTKEGRTYHASARLALLTSVRTAGKLTVDGDLSDWSVGSGNVAAGFAPIAGYSGPALEQGRGNKFDRTRCAVNHDDANVYLGIYCAGSGGERGDAPRTNKIRYDGPTPVEGELIEVLIDPTNAGTHDPADLFHVVVKRSGVAVFERGVGLSPGGGEVWAADIRYAVRDADDAWVVELAIPRDAIEADERGPVMRGLNFTRFEQATQTYTTWSGALRNAYDPASLGNLLIPPQQLDN